jgi:menaquinone-dependent protoporphyrinogen oxidase
VVHPTDQAPVLDSYDAAAIGSAVYMGRWRPRGAPVDRRRARELSQRPRWLFSFRPCGQAEPSYAAPPDMERRAQRLGALPKTKCGASCFGGGLYCPGQGINQEVKFH